MSPCLPLLLIVDDDPDIRHLYCRVLTKYFRVVMAHNGETGLARALETVPDLVLTDQNMPVCSGLEMVKRMREIPALHRVQVIVSSAYMNAELKEQFTALGVQHFFDKPCGRSELVRIASLDRTCGNSHADAATPPL